MANQNKKRPATTQGPVFVDSESAALLPSMLEAFITLQPEGEERGKLQALRHRWRKLLRNVNLKATIPKKTISSNGADLDPGQAELDRFVCSCLTFLQPDNLEQVQDLTRNLASLEWATNPPYYDPDYANLDPGGSEAGDDDRKYHPPPTFEAAQAIHKALYPHGFGAMLRLGTYGKHVHPRPIEPNPGAIDLGAHMLLSVTDSWQELFVHVEQDYGRGDSSAKRPRHSDRSESLQEVGHWCLKAKTRNPLCIKLLVRREKLFDWDRDVQTPIDLNKAPVSLHSLLDDNTARRAFTDNTKCILWVLVSHAVLNFHRTCWLQQTWDSGDIVFYYLKKSDRLPLMPFLKLRLSGPDDCNAKRPHEEAQQSAPDKWQDKHPNMTTLAVLLLEIYFITPFDTLAKAHCPRLSLEDFNPSNRHFAVDAVYRACRKHIGKRYLHQALDSLLDPKLWRETADDVSTTMYREVVKPLETELEDGWVEFETVGKTARKEGSLEARAVPQESESLDEYAQREYNLCAFGPIGLVETTTARRGLKSKDSSLLDQRVSLPSHRPSFSTPTTPEANRSSSLSHENDQLRTPPESASRTSTRTIAGHTKSEMHESNDSSKLLEKRYKKWRQQLQNIQDEFIGDLDELNDKRVKIAILDTGIDTGHPRIRAGSERIKAQRSWTEENLPLDTAPDLDGHGTYVADLLLAHAPCADLYVAKITTKDSPSTPRAGMVARAIEHAVTEWKVDMINMSLGFYGDRFDDIDELKDAIAMAQKTDVLMFASASNNGALQVRTFPANQDEVICVHSTDTHGNPSNFNPSPFKDEINLATVGENVPGAWPLALCEKDCIMKTLSGSSTAAPIMVGIAAFLLVYMRLNLSEKIYRPMTKPRMERLLMCVAQKGPRQDPKRNNFYIVDLSPEKGSIFSKEKAIINDIIKSALDP